MSIFYPPTHMGSIKRDLKVENEYRNKTLLIVSLVCLNFENEIFSGSCGRLSSSLETNFDGEIIDWSNMFAG